MSASSSSSQLSSGRLFLYGLADMPVMMSIFPAIVFIPRFYTADVGIAVGTVATVILLTRILDVFTDPLMGYISDRTKTPWGRRKPWVVLATPILMVSIYRLYMPPEGVDEVYMFTWMVGLGLGTTMMLIPYYAWGAELSSDYNERSRITGWRSGLGAFGQFLAQAVPAAAIALSLISGDTPSVLVTVGTVMLIVMPVCVFLTVTFTPDPQTQVSSVTPVLAGLKLMVSNGPFLRLIFAFMIGSIGLNITTPLYIFFVADVLGAEQNSVFMLMCFYLSNMASIPFWVWLSRRVTKHRAYVAAFCLISAAHPCYLLLGEGDFWWMLPMTIVTGFSAGGFSQTLPNSMKADVIDLDHLQSGENRAALFFSAWSFAQKATASIGGAIALYGLALFGFQAGEPNGESELFGLRFLFSTFPSLFFLTGALLVWNFPIDQKRQREIQEQLEARAAAQA